MSRRRGKSATGNVVLEAKQIDKDVRKTVILFADIMGASEVSNHKTTKKYFEFVQDFQNLFRKTCREHLAVYHDPDEPYYLYDARGDEGLLMIFPPRRRECIEFNPKIVAGHKVGKTNRREKRIL